jgi:hypothetical protein
MGLPSATFLICPLFNITRKKQPKVFCYDTQQKAVKKQLRRLSIELSIIQNGHMAAKFFAIR